MKRRSWGGLTFLGNNDSSGVIKFTVPSGGSKVLAIKFDIKGYQNWRTIWLSLAAGCIAITAILALFILADYGMKFKEQQRAFSAVDLIMSDVPAPYARLDEDGKFSRVNDAFAHLMSYQSAAQATAELSQYSYEQFLYDDASKDLYHTIKQERRDGKPYRSYTVQLWTGGKPGLKPIRWLKVHGGDVPTPHTSRTKPGQSFGILLPVEAPRPVVLIDQKSATEVITESADDEKSKTA